MSKQLNILLVIIIGGALDAISGELLDNKEFNFHNGFKHLIGIAITGAIIAVAAWYRSKYVHNKVTTPTNATSGKENKP